jgi:hypothetical protein
MEAGARRPVLPGRARGNTPGQRELAAEYTDLARYELAVARKVLDRLDTETDEIPARDLAGTLRNVKVSSAVGTDKAQLLRDEPTEIKQPMSSAQIARELKALGVRFDVEGPVFDAEVVEDRQLPEGGDEAG